MMLSRPPQPDKQNLVIPKVKSSKIIIISNLNAYQANKLKYNLNHV